MLVEAVIALVLLLIFAVLIFLPQSYPSATPLQIKSQLLRCIKGYEVEVRELVIANQSQAIKEVLKNCLQRFELAVCFEVCPGIELNVTPVYSIVYFFAGNHTHLKPARLLVYGW